MKEMEYDRETFDMLFREEPSVHKKCSNAKAAPKKKTLVVIDGKHTMNGGIILTRLKIDYKNLAEMVDAM